MRVEAAGSILLITAAVLALVWANVATSSYDSFWHTPIALEIGDWRLVESLQHWVNDALMVIFFFVVGLEIKYELVNGDLRDPRSAALPMIARSEERRVGKEGGAGGARQEGRHDKRE